MSSGGTENKAWTWVKQNWTLLLAGFMFLLFISLGSEPPEPPRFMQGQGSGLESMLHLFESGQFTRVMDSPSLRAQFLQEFVFWLVLPLALVFVLVNYAVNSALQDSGLGKWGSGGDSEKLALPVATILTLMLFASKQYTDVAAFVNGFSIAGVFIAFLAVIYIIGKTLWESMSN